MDKKELLFYDAYEEFYTMATHSKAFQSFCKEAFGEDFSQDGFSNINQIEMIFEYIPNRDHIHILDIGCGNGKMLGYLQKRTNAFIYGFDYSQHAIENAKKLFTNNAQFDEGIIGEIEYPQAKFDLITSMDTMYFAPNMTSFVAQIKNWLKDDGVLFVGYQEGDVIPKTQNAQTTMFANALEQNKMKYEVYDITKQTYDLLKKKREVAISHKEQFASEGHLEWYDMLIAQTDCINEPFECFKEKMARYIYIVRK